MKEEDECFCEDLCDVEKDDKDATKAVARHLNLPQHSTLHMAICALSFLNGGMESKSLEQIFLF